MATKRRRAGKKKRVATAAARRSRKGASGTKQDAKAAEHFVRGVLIRGEAAKRNARGELPLEATHEIVATPGGKLPVIRRRRFKLA